MTGVVVLTVEQLRSMRAVIVDGLPWHETEADLRRHAENWDLTQTEAVMLEELARIDALLADTPTT